MKRSEAIKLIKSHYDCFTSGCSSSEESEDHASQMLSKLEEAGMLPPYKDGKEPFGHNEGYIAAPIWEPENEKK
jgi:hypothetical protein